jgi:phenylpropionate dioxygenase-like ring-hydroxylating dioxygenase large terminal subunit
MTYLEPYRRYWHAVAISSAVTGAPRRVTLLDEPIVLFRTNHGICAFKDLCIHRGSALSLGRILGDRIECAYHGWQYDHTGACVRIPALPEGHSIPAKAHAIAYAVREHAGLVWVALEPPVAAFPIWPKGCEYEGPGNRGHIVGEYSWTVGAGRAIENYLDIAHLAFVHDGTLGRRDAPLVEKHQIEQDADGFHFAYVQEEPGDPQTASGGRLDLHYYYRVPLTAHLVKTNPCGGWSCISLIAAPTTATTSQLFVTCVRNYDLDPATDRTINEFVDLAMQQDKAIVSSVRPEEIPIDLREELHLKVPDAAGLVLRRVLSRVEGADGRA